MKQQAQAWRNRIVSSGEKPASDFLAHHLNWRVHPRAQQDALEGVLDQVGWVQNVIESARSGELLDGHARVTLALRRGDDTPVPYVQVDVTPEEEALILASIDPLSAMAAADKEQLDALLREVDTGSAALQEMLAGLAEKAGIGVTPVDEALPTPLEASELEGWGDLARRVIVVFADADEEAAFYAALGWEPEPNRVVYRWGEKAGSG